jgi:hypothetical protein
VRRFLSCGVVVLALSAVAPAWSSPILGRSQASLAATEQWAAKHGATRRFGKLAPLYWRLAPPRGVRPDVAYAQAAKETGFGHFGGVIDASFHNPCGLKRHAGGGNYDRTAHQRFPSWRAGVTAHLDHLALYAGKSGYPRARTPDPRHFRFLRGQARTIEALGAAWAPASAYGHDVAQLVTELDRAGGSQVEPVAPGQGRDSVFQRLFAALARLVTGALSILSS